MAANAYRSVLGPLLAMAERRLADRMPAELVARIVEQIVRRQEAAR